MDRVEFDQLIDLATQAFYAFSNKRGVDFDRAFQKYRLTFNGLLKKYERKETDLTPDSIFEQAQALAKLSPRQFQVEIARQINTIFEVSYPLVEKTSQRRNSRPSSPPSDTQSEKLKEKSDDVQEADVVIVGGGPIGYAQALGFKKLNPHLQVVILEKYPVFKRKHTLVLQPKQLESYMKATDLTKEPRLARLLKQLRKRPHVRTNVLQETLKDIATEYGVKTVIEEVKPESVEQQVFRYKPKLIVGADGTHSVVNQNLFPRHNQTKHEVDYAMQLRYEINGDAEDGWERTIEFYQKLARQGLVATEQIGHRDPKTNKTPVTVQLIISKEDFDLLDGIATAANPIELFGSKKNAGLLPERLKKCITGYIAERIKLLDQGSGQSIDKDSIKISVNELPALRAQDTHTLYNETDVSINGDAALGLSYFKGLNAGLEALAKYFGTLKPAIQQGLTDKPLLRRLLGKYQEWFSPYADKKVDEVKEYSALRVRSFMKIVKVYRDIKLGFSQMEYDVDQEPLIDSYYKLLANTSSDERVEFDFYPHRNYDPNIKLGQFDYVPISYSLKKTAKLFVDFFKPYKGDYQLVQDFKQPFVGIVNGSSGVIKLLAGLFTFDIYRFADGLASLIRGVIELATTPLVWFIKPIIRFGITIFTGLPKVEENQGMVDLVTLGEELLVDQEDDDFSFVKMQQVLGVCNDLHRKFSKQVMRAQETDIDIDREEELIEEITSQSTPLKLETVKNYFTLFGGQFPEVSDLDEDSLQEDSTFSAEAW
ncbi:hypothetical protein [Legionella micdadei]|uniref:Uncharacterized protein n=1 Tax=Legionella micdadei TaxID=451 RepID=A0A098GJV3_LEGMI|nr:hypothetical protein [Legionella micdadei]ARG98679.1 hypothetical protein B6N58_13985 [Legionella micdadei]KTD28886.1 Kynurenine 3-monooxygenase [Legionella micdadei]NSL17098.1 hypothetical protein [Legionella micdadei]CEG62267.1 conserved protein of unknown function [Legionella micdadei]SCY05496.1 hypothetical protein SAMN02982997_00727 [Legionella micdadei]